MKSGKRKAESGRLRALNTLPPIYHLSLIIYHSSFITYFPLLHRQSLSTSAITAKKPKNRTLQIMMTNRHLLMRIAGGSRQPFK